MPRCATRASPLLSGFRDAVRREALRLVVAECVRDGNIDRMHAALTDPAAIMAEAARLLAERMASTAGGRR